MKIKVTPSKSMDSDLNVFSPSTPARKWENKKDFFFLKFFSIDLNLWTMNSIEWTLLTKKRLSLAVLNEDWTK